MSETIQPWDMVRRRWEPDSHTWYGMESIPIETARNEILDLCDGIDAANHALAVERNQIAKLHNSHSAELGSWQRAFGFLTALAPDMEIDIHDPMGMARAIQRHVLAERAALAAATADRDAVLKANGTLNQELRAMQAEHRPDRLGTHWAGCWRDGGRRHWQCAVAEAERQTARAEAAEAKLDAVGDYAIYYRDVWDEWRAGAPAPLDFADWLAQQSEVQP